VLCDIVDVGPWNGNDPYWETGGRPQAESGVAQDGRRTNLAGIDLTPAAARQLGIDGKGAVEWEFAAPSAAQPSMEISMLSRIMQRLDQLEGRVAENARRADAGLAPRDVSTSPTPGSMPGSFGPMPAQIPAQMPGPDDVTALLERLVPLVERLQGQGMVGGTVGSVPGVTPIATPQPAQLGKALDLLKTILVPGADSKSQPLGQVNGALGQTIGNLLNGKKTALGLLGAVATPLLTQASTSTALAPVLALLTPAAGLAPFVLPVFLGLTAWGVLGKMEKWSQGTAPLPKA
jgi:hypothetical protein